MCVRACVHACVRVCHEPFWDGSFLAIDKTLHFILAGNGDNLTSDSDASDEEEDRDKDVELNKKDRRDSAPRRLWDSNLVYPAGVRKWDNTQNCNAAVEFVCPCGNRCLSHVGGLIAVYEHRKMFWAKVHSAGSGGIRDVLRKTLTDHYDAALGTFTRSFVVGSYGRVCERAYAVACSVSEPTFVRARCDVTNNRGWHAERAVRRQQKESEERRSLEGWVCLQRETMEGDKINGLKWYTEKTTRKQLWNKYLESCDRANQPSIGSSKLLHRIWKEHKEYEEKPPTGHAVCSTCLKIASDRLALEGLIDAESNAERKRIEERQAAHNAFHLRERKYYDEAVTRAAMSPLDLTTVTIDAPTTHQFNLPNQPKARRDTAKKVEGTERWKSKLEGVLDAGSKLELPCDLCGCHPF